MDAVCAAADLLSHLLAAPCQVKRVMEAAAAGQTHTLLEPFRQQLQDSGVLTQCSRAVSALADRLEGCSADRHACEQKQQRPEQWRY